MRVTTWSSREPLHPAFTRSWNDRLAGSTHANYAMRLDVLEWEAAAGRHTLAALVDGERLRGAIVLREDAGGWVSGWPWRWQAVLEEPAEREDAAGIDPAECERLFAGAERLAAGRRLCCHLPASPPQGSAGFVAGVTLVRSLGRSDEDILRSMDSEKRRVTRRARKEGLEVIEATTHAEFRAYARLQVDTEVRRGQKPAPLPELPAPGEAWREWEHPWMKLFVAVRDGEVLAGSGFGWQPGGMLDYRTNASNLEAKKRGANVLLAFEAMRRAREAGLRWVNWGGDTEFKRAMGGDPIAVGCRLGGGLAWLVPNHVQATMRRARPRIVSWWRSLQPRAEAPTR